MNCIYNKNGFLAAKKTHHKELHIFRQATIFESVQADTDQSHNTELEFKCSVFSCATSLGIKMISVKTH